MSDVIEDYRKRVEAVEDQLMLLPVAQRLEVLAAVLKRTSALDYVNVSRLRTVQREAASLYNVSLQEPPDRS